MTPSAATAESPVCPGAAFVPFFDAGEAPVHVGYLYPTREAALAAPQGRIRLAYCARSGYIANSAFDARLAIYEPGYEISLHHSPRYQSFLEETAQRLSARYDLAGKTVLEIGCGTGHFLELLCQTAGCAGIGVDPCVPEARTAEADGQRVRYVRAAFSADLPGLACDLICCRHVLQHLPDARGFLSDVFAVAARQDAALYLELPNGAYVFEEEMVWNVFYEHYAYITPDALAYLLQDVGFDVHRVAPVYSEGQYLYAEATSGSGSPRPAPPAPALTDALAHFAAARRAREAAWHDRLRAFHDAGRRVAAWGSGGRGLTFLHAAQAHEAVACVVDINPDRQDRFAPGTGLRIVAPEFLRRLQPDVVVATNPTYVDEIHCQLEQFGVHAELMVA